MNKQEAISILKEHNQEHVIKRLEALGDDAAKKLISQVAMIDWKVVESIKDKAEDKGDAKKIEPLAAVEINDIKKNKEKYTAKGVEAIKNGKVAAVLLAGGQGTRLGLDKPKGTLNVGVNKDLFLFGQLIHNLMDVVNQTGAWVPLYIMTSDKNNKDTVEFFEEHNYFGYDKKYVTIFTQSELPLIDEQGKMLIGKDLKIKEASDGNGGTYSSLRASGCLADMKKRGIKWVFIGSVDNALLKMADVTLLGMAIDKKVQIASKSVVKANPHERVGVFCKMNGHPKVIEYTELPEKMAEEVDENGELKYGESHIMCNLYTIDAIEKISKEILMYHSAHKKNSYIDENGKEVIPTEPNSYKFESFIFDAFEFFDDIAILRGKREDDFAPVKNKEGVDSPKTAKELYEKFWG